MITITKDLNPVKEYSFQTSPSGRTLPMTVKQFLNCSYAKEELITVDDGFGSDLKRIWSTYDGWDVQTYSELVCKFVGFIDKAQDVNPEFIDSAIGDGLSVSLAVNSWFEGSELSVEIEHHAAGTSGLLDIDIQGVDTVRRVVLGMDIKKRDMFNIYYGESTKGGGTWDKDLVTTLRNYFQSKAA
ncbi:MAG: hypothetical protein HAW67_05240 [Endozoicomonadaceae bacterium]|nr:hypothetical protein [Endozoicomonadaceae bacterium]